MTNYVFESMTAEQAAAFVSTDTLTFSTPGATARDVTLTLVPYIPPNFFTGEVGSTPSVTITFGGKTLVFNGSGTTPPGIAGLGSSAGQITFPDGSRLFIGSQGADSVSGGTTPDALHGGDGADTLAGLAGDDYLQGNQGSDSLAGGSGSDTLLGGQGDDTLGLGDGQNYGHGNLGSDTLLGGTSADT
ncbi:MAG: calcium-binding protein, partial [Alphaproteobacteria bacterium]